MVTHSKWLDQLWEDPDPHSIPAVHSQSHTWSQSPLLPWQLLKLLHAELKPKLLNSAPRPQPPDPFWFHVLVPGAIISVTLSPLISIPPGPSLHTPFWTGQPSFHCAPRLRSPSGENHTGSPHAVMVSDLWGPSTMPGSPYSCSQSFPLSLSLRRDDIITSLEILPTPSPSTGNLSAPLENETTSQPHLTSIHNYSFSSSSLGVGWGPYSVLWIPSATVPRTPSPQQQLSISVPAPSDISEGSTRHIKMLNTLPFKKNSIYWKWQTSIEYV